MNYANVSSASLNPPSTHYIIRYGIHKDILRRQMYGSPEISSTLQSCLLHYKKLYWSVAYLLEQMKIAVETGTVTRYNKSFILVFSRGCSRGKLLMLAKENPFFQVSISFREAQPEYGLLPVALVSF